MNIPKTESFTPQLNNKSWDCAKMNIPKTTDTAWTLQVTSWDCAKMNIPKTEWKLQGDLSLSWCGT